MQLDSRRRVAVSSSLPDVVRAQILDMMVTKRGERVHRATYGAGVPEMLFSNIDPVIFRAKEADITAFIQARLRYGNVHSVNISEVPDEMSTIVVTVLFTLIPGGEVFTMSQTFTGLATEESFA